jgi:hypothetical protein
VDGLGQVHIALLDNMNNGPFGQRRPTGGFGGGQVEAWVKIIVTKCFHDRQIILLKNSL